MSRDPHERPWGRRFHRLAARGHRPGGDELRRLDRLGLAGLLLSLAALSGLALSAPALRLPDRLVALGILVLGGVTALLLRQRFWTALEAELERRKLAEQSARAAESAKSGLLARVSHEIRSPMHGILALTDLLLRSRLAADQRRQAELLRTSAESLLALAEDILEASRIDARHLRLRPRDFDLRELAGEVVRLSAPRAAERELDLRLHVDAAVPDALHGDPVRLRQVLLNLVGNAVRFTRRGSVTLNVTPAEDGEAKAAIRFEVRDTGVGIRPEHRARLFEPFSQVGSSGSGVLSGTGLGLAISKSIVELMGGEIGFESTRGVGSTFWFRLPLERARGGGIAPLTPPPDPVDPARRNRRILVVDDRGVNRSVGLALLAELGFAAEAVAGGEEALARLEERRFDAVLLDCEMPGVDGFETCHRLRRHEGAEAAERRVPVIAVTGRNGPDDLQRCLAAGMDDRLVKPFGSVELAAVLDHRLGIDGSAPAGDDLAARLAALERLDETTGESTVAAFLRQGESDLATVRRALPEADREALAAASHALAGSAGLLGAADLAARAADVATAARQGDLAGCSERVPALERAWTETVKQWQG